ncbi:MAG TPA: hypothetical protein VKN99_20690 [Polyangia bacterium]|nr:hypothetical protein [Polyangia bacterium]
MSLRNRARSLQEKTGLSYQQALAKLRALAEQPARLSKQTGWPLEVCDRFLVDGHAPVDVVEVVPTRMATREELIVKVCETLRATANARAVVVAGKNGRILAHVGRDEMLALVRSVFAHSTVAPTARLRLSPEMLKRWAELPDVWELGGGMVQYRARFNRGTIVVQFHRDETSLGLVRLRTVRAIDDLEWLLADAEKSPGMPPVGGAGGPGGIPAEVRVVEETRAPPPEPKPKPIGRRKKRRL